MSASAFTVDFTQHVGDSTTYFGPGLPAPGAPVAAPTLTPIVVEVPGYGNVEFQVTNSVTTGPQLAVENHIATVTTEFSNQVNEPIAALAFSDQTEVQITFDGNVPFDIDFDFVGVGLGEDFDLGRIDDNTYTVSFSSVAGPVFIGNDENQGGLRAVSFSAAPIPEPSSALLGSLAMLGLLRRRR